MNRHGLAVLDLPPAFIVRLIGQADRDSALERYHRMQDRLMVGGSDTGTESRYVGNKPLPAPDWEHSSVRLREYMQDLQRRGIGLAAPVAAKADPEDRRRQELLRQRELFDQRRQMREGGMQA